MKRLFFEIVADFFEGFFELLDYIWSKLVFLLTNVYVWVLSLFPELQELIDVLAAEVSISFLDDICGNFG